MARESKDTIHYVFSSEKPFTRFLDLECEIPVEGRKDEIHLALSYWRPGRYEPGNFARNIRALRVFSENMEPLSFRKTDKQTWKVFCRGVKKIIVRYQYYASELNAGSCYVDDHQLYVNPVHCVFRCPEMARAKYLFRLKVPSSFRVACSLPFNDGYYHADSYDVLADSPFVASDRLQSHTFNVNGIPFHIHICGICQPDFEQITRDFSTFIRTHLDFWQDVPFPEYHFIFQITPFSFYHGVEHQNCTVIAIGPGNRIYQRELYLEVLGISSHELFHAWNIKTLRPASMLPYDYSRENYSELGFVYEGFTTYFGDKLLLSAGLYSYQEYLQELSLRFKRHIHNPGRFNYSLLESSFDTWLDGYTQAIPYRRTSIYDEGCLVALLLDVEIFKNSEGKRGLKDVCRKLWKKHGYLKSGYTYEDVENAVKEAGGDPAVEILKRYVELPADMTDAVMAALEYLGVHVELKDSPFVWERYLGIRLEKGMHGHRVTGVLPDTPAWNAEIFMGDEILAINGNILGDELQEWLRHYLFDRKATLTLSRENQILQKEIQWSMSHRFYCQPVMELHRVESNERIFFRWAAI